MAVTSTASKSPEIIESMNPATGEVIGTVPVCSDDQVNAAVRRAREAADEWGALSSAERREQLTGWRRALAARAEDLADVIHRENGKPLVDAMAEVMASLNHMQHAINRADKALRERRVATGLMPNYRATISYRPLGVVGVIGPWNFPMFTPFGSIAYALVAGNTVVFKPSELTSLVGQLFVEIAAESIPTRNVLQIVTGDGRTGAALARADVDKIAFTGSAPTGRRVMQAAAERLTPVLMELGGKDAMIVADDADLERAAQDAVFGAFMNAGQACVSVERCYVHRSVYKPFLDKVLEEVKAVRVGEHYGPITLPKQIGIIREHLQDAITRGATVLCGGPDQIQGSFVYPTVLTNVTPEMKIMTEETFGPVLPIVSVRSVDEAVELANSTNYGLASSVYGKAGVRKVAARLRAGMTSINAMMATGAIPGLPFGGIGESGFGRIHGDEGIREFTLIKSTAEERFATPFNLLSFKLPENMYDRLVKMIDQLYGDGVVSKVRDGLNVRKFFS